MLELCIKHALVDLAKKTLKQKHISIVCHASDVVPPPDVHLLQWNPDGEVGPTAGGVVGHV